MTHAEFIEAVKGMSVIELMELVQNTVYDKYGVRLEPEVRIIGEF